MSNLSKNSYIPEPVTLVKSSIFFYEYYDYTGRVKVDRKLDGSISDVYIKHPKFIGTVCHIDKRYFKKFAEYEGEIIRFRGRLNLGTNATVTPHIS